MHPRQLLLLVAASLCTLLAPSAVAAAAAAADAIETLQVPAKIPQSVVLDSVSNVVDLTRTMARQETTVIVRGLAKRPLTSVYVAQPHQAAQAFLALFEVRLGDQNGKLLGLAKDVAYDNVQYYTVRLASPLAEGAKVTLFIKSVYVHHVRPYPHEITQMSPQLYEFLGNIYYMSPYPSEKQRTTVKLPGNKDPKTYTQDPAPVAKRGNQIIYGPYSSVPALAQGKLYLHYPDHNAVLVAKEYKKLMEVSHWGANLAVQEDYEIHHKGAKLKGHFSRVDYKLMGFWNADATSVVKDLTAILPPKASSVFFRDAIGNVSTSRFRNDADRSVLWMQPRYPLYGGWKYTWFHGYNVPSESFLKRDTSSGRYVLQVPFKASISDLTVEQAIFRVVLPEGASDVQVDSSLPMDSVSNSITFTYLDTTGRPTVTLTKRNLVDDYNGLVQISYAYDSSKLLQKPLVVAAYVFGFFLVFVVYSRLDLSITKDPSKIIEERLDAYRVQVGTHAAADAHALKQLQDAFELFKSTHDVPALKAVHESTGKAFEQSHKALAAIATQTTSIDAAYARRVSDLVGFLRDRFKAAMALQNEVVQFLVSGGAAGGSGAGVDAAKKKAIATFAANSEAIVAALSNQIANCLQYVSE
ncbi:Ribophorin I-domain-containing protein [Entophlyctis helioformis]|nr:Ribophorin I-domain-containing protein [Entophlyctis helioformis]